MYQITELEISSGLVGRTIELGGVGEFEAKNTVSVDEIRGQYNAIEFVKWCCNLGEGHNSFVVLDNGAARMTFEQWFAHQNDYHNYLMIENDNREAVPGRGWKQSIVDAAREKFISSVQFYAENRVSQ